MGLTTPRPAVARVTLVAIRALLGTLVATLVATACGGDARATDDRDAAAASTVADSMTVADAGATLPSVRAGALTIARVVAPAPIADAPMALYLEIANAGATDDTLVAIAVGDVGSASLHETVGGTMRPLARLAIPAGGRVALRPGGRHGMIERAGAGAGAATRAFAPGDTLRATLRFARAGDVAIAAPVVAYADLERLLGAAAGDPHTGH